MASWGAVCAVVLFLVGFLPEPSPFVPPISPTSPPSDRFAAEELLSSNDAAAELNFY